MSAKIEFEGKKYRVNGIEMNVVVEGQGRDLVLVHGFPDSIAVWRHQIPTPHQGPQPTLGWANISSSC